MVFAQKWDIYIYIIEPFFSGNVWKLDDEFTRGDVWIPESPPEIFHDPIVIPYDGSRPSSHPLASYFTVDDFRVPGVPGFWPATIHFFAFFDWVKRQGLEKLVGNPEATHGSVEEPSHASKEATCFASHMNRSDDRMIGCGVSFGRYLQICMVISYEVTIVFWQSVGGLPLILDTEPRLRERWTNWPKIAVFQAMKIGCYRQQLQGH